MQAKVPHRSTYTDSILENCVIIRAHSKAVHQEAERAAIMLENQLYSLDMVLIHQSMRQHALSSHSHAGWYRKEILK